MLGDQSPVDLYLASASKCHNYCRVYDYSVIIRRFVFYFLVYGSSDPNFCILEKN